MASVTIFHPEVEAVAAALRALDAAQAEVAFHLPGCLECQVSDPFRYKTCKIGHQLAAAVLARRLEAVNADAAASGPGPGLGPVRGARAAAG